MAIFDITLRTQGSLHPHGEPDDFISEYTGLIRCYRDRDGKVCRVGKIRACRLHTDLAAEAGEPLFDVCDAHSQDMADLYAALFDPETDDLKEEIGLRF